MNFEDSTFLAFENPVSTEALFSQEALTAVVAAAYRLPLGSLAGTPSVRFDRVSPAPFSGQIHHEMHGDHHSVTQMSASADAPGGSVRADALLQGEITLNAAFPRAVIGVAAVGAPDLEDLDADIAGTPPSDPAALEAARRTVLLARLRANAHDPEAVTMAVIDDWIARTGSGSLGAFLAAAGASSVPLAQYVLSFTPQPGTSSAAPIAFPFAVTAMVRDVARANFLLVDFMQAAQDILTRMQIEGIAPKAGDEGVPMGRATVAWMVSEDWFDDTGWPGGTTGNAAARKADRISRATAWLAQHQIALVPIGG